MFAYINIYNINIMLYTINIYNFYLSIEEIERERQKHELERECIWCLYKPPRRQQAAWDELKNTQQVSDSGQNPDVNAT